MEDLVIVYNIYNFIRIYLFNISKTSIILGLLPFYFFKRNIRFIIYLIKYIIKATIIVKFTIINRQIIIYYLEFSILL